MRERNINSPNTFKTCYIAEVKEELGLIERKAPNRLGTERKVKAPEDIKDLIRKAIYSLQKENKNMTYKMIQERAFAIYQQIKKHDKKNRYFGCIKPSGKFSSKDIKKIIDDEDFGYEDQSHSRCKCHNLLPDRL